MGARGGGEYCTNVTFTIGFVCFDQNRLVMCTSVQLRTNDTKYLLTHLLTGHASCRTGLDPFGVLCVFQTDVDTGEWAGGPLLWGIHHGGQGGADHHASGRESTQVHGPHRSSLRGTSLTPSIWL